MNAPDVRIEIAAAPFDPYAALRAFSGRHCEAGAIASFIGLVRGEGGDVKALSLDHYPGFTEGEIGRIAGEACARWPLFGLAIMHRVGALQPGEPIVLVAAASRSRRAAFEAVDFLMDYLKSEAPFWKKETRGGEIRWVEPRAEDLRDKSRWNAKEE